MFLTLYEQRFGRASSVHFQALMMKKGSSVTINEDRDVQFQNTKHKLNSNTIMSNEIPTYN